MKWYLGCSGLLAIGCVFFNQSSGCGTVVCKSSSEVDNFALSEPKQIKALPQGGIFSNEVSNLFLSMVLSLYIIIGLFSCIFAVRRLSRPGVSKEIRIFFIRKHIAYVCTFILTWTFSLIGAYYHLYHPVGSPNSELVT
jgi:hypothetical protein